MKNLENFGVHELSSQEVIKIDGGILPYVRVVAKFLGAFAAFDAWYQESGYIDRNMGMPFTA
jgi:hypothetical protein